MQPTASAQAFVFSVCSVFFIQTELLMRGVHGGLQQACTNLSSSHTWSSALAPPLSLSLSDDFTHRFPWLFPESSRVGMLHGHLVISCISGIFFVDFFQQKQIAATSSPALPASAYKGGLLQNRERKGCAEGRARARAGSQSAISSELPQDLGCPAPPPELLSAFCYLSCLLQPSSAISACQQHPFLFTAASSHPAIRTPLMLSAHLRGL